MRYSLKGKVGEIDEYTAEFACYSSEKSTGKVNKALLLNVYQGNKLITDHMWIPSRLIDVFLERGTRIRFSAKVGTYSKKRFKSRSWVKQSVDYNFETIEIMELIQ